MSKRGKKQSLCKCGCGQLAGWNKKGYWNEFIKGHHRRKHRRMGDAPLCQCGCDTPVNWVESVGWRKFCIGHARKGVAVSLETRGKMMEAACAREAKKRLQTTPTEFFDPSGVVDNRAEILKTLGVSTYNTSAYRVARMELVAGRPCLLCGSTEYIHAHHVVPGNDDTLIPLCRQCHPTVHAGSDAKGMLPPLGEDPPLCACGCGRSVRWKRWRGWAEFCKGHGNAKVPAMSQFQKAPLCKCGCGKSVTFRYGKGWNEYKTGHRQRIEGVFHRRSHGPAPLCACGCDQKVEWKHRSGYPKYIPGHRPIHAGRKPPEGEQPPKCACGCGGDCGWIWGHGWSRWIRNHDKRKANP